MSTFKSKDCIQVHLYVERKAITSETSLNKLNISLTSSYLEIIGIKLTELKKNNLFKHINYHWFK